MLLLLSWNLWIELQSNRMLWMVWASVPTTNTSPHQAVGSFLVHHYVLTGVSFEMSPKNSAFTFSAWVFPARGPALACLYWHVFFMEAWSPFPSDIQEETIPFIWTLRGQSGVINWTNFSTVSQRIGVEEREEKLGNGWHWSSQNTHDICEIQVLCRCCLWHSKPVVRGNQRSLTTDHCIKHRRFERFDIVWELIKHDTETQIQPMLLREVAPVNLLDM